METSNKQTITLDLRQTTVAPLPQFIQFDTNILEFIVKDNGADADLTNVDRITVNYKRPDSVIISRLLTAVGNVVVYEIGAEEMEVPGYGELDIQFFEGENRISSKRVKVYFATSLGASFERGAGFPLLQDLFIEVADLIVGTDDAANFALTQGNYAKTQGDYSKAQGDYAKSQGDYGKTQGDYAKTQGDNIESRISNLIQNAPQPSEIVDVRTDPVGNVYPTAKARIDAAQTFTDTESNKKYQFSFKHQDGHLVFVYENIII